MMRVCLPSTFRLMPLIHESISLDSSPTPSDLTWSVHDVTPALVAAMRVTPCLRAKRTADACAGVEHAHAQAKFAQPVELVEARHARADDDDVVIQAVVRGGHVLRLP